MFDVAGNAHGESASAGSSAEQTGAVRSWPGSTPSDDSPAAGGDARQLSAMRLPDLQRLAQSLGLAGTARMRKGQLIAAIEEAGTARQGSAPTARGSSAASYAGAASQSESSGNSVKRIAPAGAGANRPFEQDAMESESGQLSMVSSDPAGPGVGTPNVTAGGGEPHAPQVTRAGTGPAAGESANGTDFRRQDAPVSAEAGEQAAGSVREATPPDASGQD